MIQKSPPGLKKKKKKKKKEVVVINKVEFQPCDFELVEEEVDLRVCSVCNSYCSEDPMLINDVKQFAQSQTDPNKNLGEMMDEIDSFFHPYAANIFGLAQIEEPKPQIELREFKTTEIIKFDYEKFDFSDLNMDNKLNEAKQDLTQWEEKLKLLIQENRKAGL